jgi:hypothetical protein
MALVKFLPVSDEHMPARVGEESWAFKAGLWILQWTIIIFVSVALFYLLKLTLPDSRDVTRRLNNCLEPKIHRGHYVSDDDGKSAEALLNQCPAEVDKWTTWCQRYSGDDRTICAVKVIALAQNAIKSSDK